MIRILVAVTYPTCFYHINSEGNKYTFAKVKCERFEGYHLNLCDVFKLPM